MENIRTFVPECVRDFKLDWSNYTPAGGWDWQEKFHTSTVPEIKKRIEDIRSAVSATATWKEKVSDLTRSLSRAVDAIKALSCDDIGKRTVSDAIVARPELTDWLACAPENLGELISALNKSTVKSSVITASESELAFLDALISYFTLDLEFDMLMWCLNEIPVKYRTKVFRIASRKYAEVSEAKRIVENSNCDAAVVYRNRLETPLSELAIGYSKIPLVMRAIRKSIDKKGELAWADPDFVLSAQLRDLCADGCRSAKWVA